MTNEVTGRERVRELLPTLPASLGSLDGTELRARGRFSCTNESDSEALCAESE